MRKFVRVLVILIAIIIIAVTGLLIYVKAAMPNVGKAPDIKVQTTPDRIEHGEYLANHVSVCISCHSERDYSIWSAPLFPGTLGKGGKAFTEDMGFPGNFYARNITSTHLSNWTDGEIYRSSTTVVDRNDKALFSILPWDNYGRMDPEDVKDIIA